MHQLNLDTFNEDAGASLAKLPGRAWDYKIFDWKNTAILGKATPCFPLDCIDISLLLIVYSGCTLFAHGPF
jgi:hypothetical protein